MRRLPRRIAARHYPPHHRADRVQVRPRPQRALAHLLQSRVALRERRQRFAALRRHLLRRPEVDQHRPLVRTPHQDVRRLDVAMQHPRLMHPLQAIQQRNHHRQQIRFIERTARRFAPMQQLRQRQPVLVLHHQIGRAVGAEELAAGNDARVGLELDQRPRFVAEPPQAVFVARPAVRAARMHRRPFAQRQFDGQVFLDGDDVAQLVVPRPIDDAEAAVPQHFLDRVIAQRRPAQQRVPPFLPAAGRLHRGLALPFHTRRPAPRPTARSCAAGRRSPAARGSPRPSCRRGRAGACSASCRGGR